MVAVDEKETYYTSWNWRVTDTTIGRLRNENEDKTKTHD